MICNYPMNGGSLEGILEASIGNTQQVKFELQKFENQDSFMCRIQMKACVLVGRFHRL